MSTIVDQLIFNRTQADVDRVKALKLKIMKSGLDSLSTSEKTEYLAGMKGAYNYTDLNRVGQAVVYISQQMTAFPSELKTYRESKNVADDEIFDIPYTASDVIVGYMYTWTMSEIPTKEYLSLSFLPRISNLYSLLTLPSDTPSPPQSLSGLTYKVANNIEKILYIVYQTFTDLKTTKYALVDQAVISRQYSGVWYSGE